jgi:protein involved in ribonucleotide reduction
MGLRRNIPTYLPTLASSSDPNISYDSVLNIDIRDTHHRNAIRGVVYHGHNHFTARFIKTNGVV